MSPPRWEPLSHFGATVWFGCLCDSSWLPQKDLLGHHFLRMLAFLTLLIRKLFVIAKESFHYVQRSLHITWLKPEPSVST